MEKARFLLVSLLLGQLSHISARLIIIDTYIDGFRRTSDNRPTNVGRQQLTINKLSVD